VPDDISPIDPVEPHEFWFALLFMVPLNVMLWSPAILFLLAFPSVREYFGMEDRPAVMEQELPAGAWPPGYEYEPLPLEFR
jgi:hypothetical protein